jgi:hypothetical protein
MSAAVGSLAGAATFASRQTALRNALFQAVLVMQKRAQGSGSLSIVVLVIKWLQIMSFLFISDSVSVLLLS